MAGIIELGLFAVGSLALYKILESPIKAFRQKANNTGKIGEIMDRDNLDFEDAREKLLAEKIAQIIKVEKTYYELGSYKITQGDKIRFLSLDDNKYISGDFVGVKCSHAEGYTEHICIRTDESKIIYAPVEIISIESLRVYERSNK